MKELFNWAQCLALSIIILILAYIMTCFILWDIYVPSPLIIRVFTFVGIISTIAFKRDLDNN